MKRFSIVIAVLLVIVAVLVLRGEGPAPKSRWVIINADDAGMCRSVNAATIRAMDTGLVTSASIMVPCPGFAEFAEYARTHPRGDYGVHLTLTCDGEGFHWGPVLPVEDVPSLVDSAGHFWSTVSTVAEHAEIDEVERELRAQIERALDVGIPLSHLDNHMFVMKGRPDLLEMYVQLGLEFGLPVRYPISPPRNTTDVDDERFAEIHRQQLAILERAGMPLLDRIDSENYRVKPEDKRQYFLELCRNLRPGVTEVVIHCADANDELLPPPHVARRVADTSVFTSLEVVDELDRLGIGRLTWREFGEWFGVGRAVESF